MRRMEAPARPRTDRQTGQSRGAPKDWRESRGSVSSLRLISGLRTCIISDVRQSIAGGNRRQGEGPHSQGPGHPFQPLLRKCVWSPFSIPAPLRNCMPRYGRTDYLRILSLACMLSHSNPQGRSPTPLTGNHRSGTATSRAPRNLWINRVTSGTRMQP